MRRPPPPRPGFFSPFGRGGQAATAAPELAARGSGRDRRDGRDAPDREMRVRAEVLGGRRRGVEDLGCWECGCERWVLWVGWGEENVAEDGGLIY